MTKFEQALSNVTRGINSLVKEPYAEQNRTDCKALYQSLSNNDNNVNDSKHERTCRSQQNLNCEENKAKSLLKNTSEKKTKKNKNIQKKGLFTAKNRIKHKYLYEMSEESKLARRGLINNFLNWAIICSLCFLFLTLLCV